MTTHATCGLNDIQPTCASSHQYNALGARMLKVVVFLMVVLHAVSQSFGSYACQRVKGKYSDVCRAQSLLMLSEAPAALGDRHPQGFSSTQYQKKCLSLTPIHGPWLENGPLSLSSRISRNAAEVVRPTTRRPTSACKEVRLASSWSARAVTACPSASAVACSSQMRAFSTLRALISPSISSIRTVRPHRTEHENGEFNSSMHVPNKEHIGDTKLNRIRKSSARCMYRGLPFTLSHL